LNFDERRICCKLKRTMLAIIKTEEMELGNLLIIFQQMALRGNGTPMPKQTIPLRGPNWENISASEFGNPKELKWDC
jgi:hypothetical protein